jgi:hypothetical protein
MVGTEATKLSWKRSSPRIELDFSQRAQTCRHHRRSDPKRLA